MNWPREKIHVRRGIRVSDDGNLLAYTTDNTGFRQYTLAVKDLRTGKLLPDHAERVGSVAWANDNNTIFYTTEDATTKRQNEAYRHTVGTPGPTRWSTKKKTNASLCVPAKLGVRRIFFYSPAATRPPKRATCPRISPRPNSK